MGKVKAAGENSNPKEEKKKKKKKPPTSTLSEATEKKTGLHRWIRGLGMYCIVSYIFRDFRLFYLILHRTK
jgi:hypothetical protein